MLNKNFLFLCTLLVICSSISINSSHTKVKNLSKSKSSHKNKSSKKLANNLELDSNLTTSEKIKKSQEESRTKTCDDCEPGSESDVTNDNSETNKLFLKNKFQKSNVESQSKFKKTNVGISLSSTTGSSNSELINMSLDNAKSNALKAKNAENSKTEKIEKISNSSELTLLKNISENSENSEKSEKKTKKSKNKKKNKKSHKKKKNKKSHVKNKGKKHKKSRKNKAKKSKTETETKTDTKYDKNVELLYNIFDEDINSEKKMIVNALEEYEKDNNSVPRYMEYTLNNLQKLNRRNQKFLTLRSISSIARSYFKNVIGIRGRISSRKLRNSFPDDTTDAKDLIKLACLVSEHLLENIDKIFEKPSRTKRQQQAVTEHAKRRAFDFVYKDANLKQKVTNALFKNEDISNRGYISFAEMEDCISRIHYLIDEKEEYKCPLKNNGDNIKLLEFGEIIESEVFQYLDNNF